MTKAFVAARVVLGLIFTVFGMDYFLHYLPNPGASPQGEAFLLALFATGYMFPVIKGIEIVCGVLLLAGRLVPLSLVLLGPIVANIAMYHLVLDPGLLWLAATVVVLFALVAWRHRAAFAPLFEGRVAARQQVPLATLRGAAERA